MPGTISESDNYPATNSIVRPLATEEIRSVDWVNAAGALANRTLYLSTRLEGIRAGYQRRLSVTEVNSNAFGFSFSNQGGPGSNAMGQRQTSSAGQIIWGLPLIEGISGAKLVSCTVAFHPQLAGRAGLPASQPSIKIWRSPFSAGARVQLGATSTLAAGSVVAYEAPQTLTITLNAGAGETIDNTNSYYLEFNGEADGGANYQTGLIVTYAQFVTSPV